MTSEKKPTVCDDIDSHCLKCKQVTNHTIVAMDNERVVKVQCNVCKGRHNYRPANKEKSAAAHSPSRPKKSTGTAARSPRKTKSVALFDRLLGEKDIEEALPYSMTAIFKDGDLLKHPKFGLGFVTKMIPPNKIEVLFEEGNKILVCGM